MGPESIEAVPNRETEADSFSLLEFVREWSEVFVVIGVFAGTAIYVTQFTPGPISEAPRVYRFGFFGSLIVVVLMFWLVVLQLAEEFGGLFELVASVPEPENWELAVFFLGMGFLLYSVLSVMASRGTAVLWFTRIFSLILGFWLFSWSFESLEGFLENKVNSSELQKILIRPIAYYVLFRAAENASDQYRKPSEWNSDLQHLVDAGTLPELVFGEMTWAARIIFGIITFFTAIVAIGAVLDWLQGDS